jgi:hypothetical protein
MACLQAFSCHRSRRTPVRSRERTRLGCDNRGFVHGSFRPRRSGLLGKSGGDPAVLLVSISAGASNHSFRVAELPRAPYAVADVSIRERPEPQPLLVVGLLSRNRLADGRGRRCCYPRPPRAIGGDSSSGNPPRSTRRSGQRCFWAVGKRSLARAFGSRSLLGWIPCLRSCVPPHEATRVLLTRRPAWALRALAELPSGATRGATYPKSEGQLEA